MKQLGEKIRSSRLSERSSQNFIFQGSYFQSIQSAIILTADDIAHKIKKKDFLPKEEEAISEFLGYDIRQLDDLGDDDKEYYMRYKKVQVDFVKKANERLIKAALKQ